ncbi:MAG: hypothetical protein WDZ47_11355, partial [Bacteroidales bacterium]
KDTVLAFFSVVAISQIDPPFRQAKKTIILVETKKAAKIHRCSLRSFKLSNYNQVWSSFSFPLWL